MPVNVVIALVALLAALVFYSIGAWGLSRTKAARSSTVLVLWLGFAFDVIATAGMAWQEGGGFAFDLAPAADLAHTILALLAMAGMLALAVAVTVGYVKKDADSVSSVARWALAPWALWVLVFVWGMVARGSQRMG